LRSSAAEIPGLSPGRGQDLAVQVGQGVGEQPGGAQLPILPIGFIVVFSTLFVVVVCTNGAERTG
jgi:hypothetical protein